MGRAIRFVVHKEFSRGAPYSKTPTIHPLSGGLPSTLKTSDALALFKTYFLIPQPSVRRFVLMLLARITDNTDITCPYGDSSEAEYLLTRYAQLSNDDMRNKVLALVRQICAANGGDTGCETENYFHISSPKFYADE